MENSMEIPQKLGINYHMTQQSHYWVYTLRYGFIIEKDTCTPVFTAVLFTIARTWKQPRCPSTDEWIQGFWYIYKIFSSVQSLSRVNSLQPYEPQHARPPCPSPTPGIYPNSCPSSRWCHPATSSSVISFTSSPQSLPASESFPVSQLFAWGGQSIGVSTSTSILPMNTQDWPPFEWTGWISLQSKGLSRVFSNITVQKHQFFGTQLSSQSNFHIHTWLLKKIIALTRWNFVDKCLCF